MSPPVHPMKEKAEDEDEDEGCRLDWAPTTYRLLFRAENKKEIYLFYL